MTLYITRADEAEGHKYETEQEAKDAAWEFLLAGWQVIIVERK